MRGEKRIDERRQDMQQIRVLVVDDSMFFRDMLVKSLNKDPMITVVGAAKDAYEARDAIVLYKPDVMTLDIEMPRMSGLEFLRKLMPQYPMPVVMFSSLSEKVFDALSAGAVDFVSKPPMTNRAKLEEFIAGELPEKIKIAAAAKIGNVRKKIVPHSVGSIKQGQEKVLAIGASTGGTEAIADVLKEFGPDIPGTVVVQHMPTGFTELYAKRLNSLCRVRVCEARNGDRVEQGKVLIAPGGDCHMRLVSRNGGYYVEVKEGGKVSGHRPSVDVLFDSVAAAAGANAVGVILTGMGGDGSKGLLEMRRAGAHTIGQDESTCVVYGMPKVAYDIGAVEFQEKLPDIAIKAYRLFNKM